jgi:hypothetical protein
MDSGDGLHPVRGPCASARPLPGRLVLGVGTKSMGKKMTVARIRFSNTRRTVGF